MKKTISASLLLFVLIFSSCKKSDTATVSGISGTLDGTATNFNNGASAIETPLFIVNIVTITGSQGAVGASNTLAIAFSNPDDVTPGTYSDTSSVGKSVGITYDIYPGNTQYESLDDGSTQVVVTSVSSSNIQGTFTAILSNSSASPTTHTITNGTFNVKLVQP